MLAEELLRDRLCAPACDPEDGDGVGGVLRWYIGHGTSETPAAGTIQRSGRRRRVEARTG